MSHLTHITSVVDTTPEVSAPIRLEGQSNSEVLFNWLTVKGHLWMLEAPHDATIVSIVDPRTYLRLAFKLTQWKRQRQDGDAGHPALNAPDEEELRAEAFARLRKLLAIHFFGPEEEPSGG